MTAAHPEAGYQQGRRRDPAGGAIARSESSRGAAAASSRDRRAAICGSRTRRTPPRSQGPASPLSGSGAPRTTASRSGKNRPPINDGKSAATKQTAAHRRKVAPTAVMRIGRLSTKRATAVAKRIRITMYLPERQMAIRPLAKPLAYLATDALNPHLSVDTRKEPLRAKYVESERYSYFRLALSRR